MARAQGQGRLFTKRHALHENPNLGFGPMVCPSLAQGREVREVAAGEMLCTLREWTAKAHDVDCKPQRLCLSVALVEARMHPESGWVASEHGQVVAGLGAGLECPAAGAAGS